MFCCRKCNVFHYRVLPQIPVGMVSNTWSRIILPFRSPLGMNFEKHQALSLDKVQGSSVSPLRGGTQGGNTTKRRSCYVWQLDSQAQSVSIIIYAGLCRQNTDEAVNRVQSGCHQGVLEGRRRYGQGYYFHLFSFLII